MSHQKSVDHAVKGEGGALSRDSYRQLVENMSDGVVVFEALDGGSDFRIRQFNRAAERITRTPKEEAIGAHLSQRFSICDKLGLLDVLKRVSESGIARHHPISEYRDDRLHVWIESYVFRLESGELVAIFTDVTEKIEAERALIASEERLRNAQAYANLGYWELLEGGEMALWSDEVYRILGIDKSTPTGPETLAGLIDPADRDKVLASLQRCLTEGMEHHIDYRIRRPDGAQRWLECRGKPVVDGERHVVKLRGFVQDITERKAAEKRQVRLQNELQQSHKMEALGQLAGGVAHDFNNILGIMLGHAELALSACLNEGRGKLVGHLQRIEEAGARAKSLVNQMLAFSRGDPENSQPLLLQKLLDENLSLMRATLPTSIDIATRIDHSLPAATIDPVQFSQVLLNLGVNARDAVEGKGEIGIELGWYDEAGACSACSTAVNGCWIALSFSDNGSGIDSDRLPKIFDPFYTTKDVGKGTGLGLSVVHGILHNLGGHILVESVVGEGTCIRLLFPPSENLAPATQSGVVGIQSVTEATGGARILVVDDEPQLADFLGEALETSGFQVKVMTESRAAFELYRAQPEAFELLITDQTMPGMTGLELISRVRTLTPEMPVILISGYSADIDTARAEEMGILYLEKPLRGSALVEAVANVMRGAG
jgi:PAS domain S-box-containing protein